MSNPLHHRGLVTGAISQASKWNCWGLNPWSFCLPDSRAFTLNLCTHLIRSVSVLYPYRMAMMQSNPHPQNGMLNVTLTEREREREGKQQKYKRSKDKEKRLGE